MADVFSAVVAGAQALDYSVQFSEVIRRGLNANENKKRYQQNNQELIQVLEQISKSPLQAPDVTNYSQGLIHKVQEINIPSQSKRRDRLMATISFFFKQKQHEEDSAYVEQLKATLGLYISNSNTQVLSEFSAILGSITAGQPIPQRTSSTTIPESQSGNNLSSTFHHHKPSDDRHKSGYINRRDLMTPPMLYKKPNCRPETGDIGRTSPISATQSSSDHEKQGGTIAPRESPTITLKGNVQAADSFQVIGVQITSGSNMTDADVMKATTAFRAHGNIHTGKGTQVVGQRVCAGATPRKFAGQFCENYHRGSGEQIVGLCFD